MTSSVAKPVLLKDVNDYFTCRICNGYIIDATTVTRCLHTFCRSCIRNHLASNKRCPLCEQCGMTDDASHRPKLRRDKVFQRLIYKMIPGLLQSELLRRQCFKEDAMQQPSPSLGSFSSPNRSKWCGSSLNGRQNLYTGQEMFNISLQCKNVSGSTSDFSSLMPRFLLCPAMVTVHLLKKFIQLKLDLEKSTQIDLFVESELLDDSYTLVDLAYICQLTSGDEPINIHYVVNCSLNLLVVTSLHQQHRNLSLTEIDDATSGSRARQSMIATRSANGIVELSDDCLSPSAAASATVAASTRVNVVVDGGPTTTAPLPKKRGRKAKRRRFHRMFNVPVLPSSVADSANVETPGPPSTVAAETPSGSSSAGVQPPTTVGPKKRGRKPKLKPELAQTVPQPAAEPVVAPRDVTDRTLRHQTVAEMTSSPSKNAGGSSEIPSTARDNVRDDGGVVNSAQNPENRSDLKRHSSELVDSDVEITSEDIQPKATVPQPQARQSPSSKLPPREDEINRVVWKVTSPEPPSDRNGVVSRIKMTSVRLSRDKTAAAKWLVRPPKIAKSSKYDSVANSAETEPIRNRDQGQGHLPVNQLMSTTGVRTDFPLMEQRATSNWFNSIPMFQLAGVGVSNHATAAAWNCLPLPPTVMAPVGPPLVQDVMTSFGDQQMFDGGMGTATRHLPASVPHLLKPPSAVPDASMLFRYGVQPTVGLMPTAVKAASTASGSPATPASVDEGIPDVMLVVGSDRKLSAVPRSKVKDLVAELERNVLRKDDGSGGDKGCGVIQHGSLDPVNDPVRQLDKTNKLSLQAKRQKEKESFLLGGRKKGESVVLVSPIPSDCIMLPAETVVPEKRQLQLQESNKSTTIASTAAAATTPAAVAATVAAVTTLAFSATGSLPVMTFTSSEKTSSKSALPPMPIVVSPDDCFEITSTVADDQCQSASPQPPCLEQLTTPATVGIQTSSSTASVSVVNGSTRNCSPKMSNFGDVAIFCGDVANGTPSVNCRTVSSPIVTIPDGVVVGSIQTMSAAAAAALLNRPPKSKKSLETVINLLRRPATNLDGSPLNEDRSMSPASTPSPLPTSPVGTVGTMTPPNADQLSTLSVVNKSPLGRNSAAPDNDGRHAELAATSSASLNQQVPVSQRTLQQTLSSGSRFTGPLSDTLSGDESSSPAIKRLRTMCNSMVSGPSWQPEVGLPVRPRATAPVQQHWSSFYRPSVNESRVAGATRRATPINLERFRLAGPRISLGVAGTPRDRKLFAPQAVFATHSSVENQSRSLAANSVKYQLMTSQAYSNGDWHM